MGLTKRVIKLVKSNPALMKLKLKRKNPFQNKSGHLLILCCHHKVGTTWFGKVLPAISEEFGIPLIRNDQSKLGNGAEIFFQNHSKIDFSSLQNYRGAHMIRDPRDMVLSGYYYHLWTEEEWVRMPIKDLRPDMAERWPLLPVNEIKDMSYQQYLNSLSREEGIIAEMNRAYSKDIREIMDWDYTNENFFEFKYETIRENEEETFRQLFRHYGFNHDAVERSVEIAKQFSFKNRTGRNTGDVDKKSHLRSGKLQQWRDEFNEDHKAHFKKLHGEDLIKLGYEKDLNW